MTISNGQTSRSEPPSGCTQRPPADPAEPLFEPRRWCSSELLGSRQEIEIEHGASVYRLRLTSQGKLILTK